MGYRWENFESIDRFLRETGITHQVTCMMRQRHMRLFGHVAKFPESDPVMRVISKEIVPAWRRPRGRRTMTWLQKSMVISGSWDWQDGRMHGTPLAETLRVGAGP